jgi:hypothetical protein
MSSRVFPQGRYRTQPSGRSGLLKGPQDRDAALYITKLPKAEHDAEHWQTAMEALLLVAEHDGPEMFARIGIMRTGRITP